ncbi:hypothetical protein CKF54_00285 [Psittacicella hinzii]|uniref:S1 motif domain-containing protein n=1 Tax=Psittacicella hinzii TaxID=2028575 RepID=A0A3A1YEB4_9GAMM|nr:Tex family protein [Psittacicella hinzii]RIY34467.1 hypothetical protein CKF54_00285 [Psittacicella hinzii]
MLSIEKRIAQELEVNPRQIEAAIRLINEGATIPFIARYRKEETEGLTDEQLREFQVRFNYLTDLEDRKKSIISSISEQGKLTPELEQQINDCLVKADLEYLYIPYRPKRKTKATKAREAGLEPLALELWQSTDVNLDLDKVVAPYLSEEYNTTKASLDGALLILVDNFADNTNLLSELKDYLNSVATIEAKVIEGKEKEGDKFKDYFDYSEVLCHIKSHRFLALWRGRAEGVLSLHLNPNPANIPVNPVDYIIEKHATKDLAIDLVPNTPLNSWRRQALSWTWKVKLSSILETELLNARHEMAEPDAYNSFAHNLKSLLLKSPVKSQNILGLDPGIRTGIKFATIDGQTKLLDHGVIYLIESKEKAAQKLLEQVKKHQVTLVVIGNGTACRETLEFVEKTFKDNNITDVHTLVVNEAGASVYSASELAVAEFPELDVSIRGAVSIARRALDPLAELVKIDPKSIGVGQYQHDLNARELTNRLEATIEDCVNYVGVNLNTASEYLLRRISGLNKITASNIVKFREENGFFTSRQDLLKVSRLGPKAFEQCAGFLRVVGENTNVLDNSAVHPEAYAVVEKMASDLGVELATLVGNTELLQQLDPQNYVSKKFGLPTIEDIIKELEKPGRDPRGVYEPIQYKEGIEDIKQLEVGMIMNGLVTNVTDFGAFVDIGVHTDGLVHISRMSSSFIADPYDFLKSGEQIQVQVFAVDVARNRIDLTMIFEGQKKTAPKYHVSKIKSEEEAQRLNAVLEQQKEYLAQAENAGLEVDLKLFKLLAKPQHNQNNKAKNEHRAKNESKHKGKVKPNANKAQKSAPKGKFSNNRVKEKKVNMEEKFNALLTRFNKK